MLVKINTFIANNAKEAKAPIEYISNVLTGLVPYTEEGLAQMAVDMILENKLPDDGRFAEICGDDDGIYGYLIEWKG